MQESIMSIAYNIFPLSKRKIYLTCSLGKIRNKKKINNTLYTGRKFSEQRTENSNENKFHE